MTNSIPNEILTNLSFAQHGERLQRRDWMKWNLAPESVLCHLVNSTHLSM